MKLNLKAADALNTQKHESEAEHHILIVDDEPANLIGLARILSRDYQVTTATSAAEALQLLDQNPQFSAIISDHIMPQMSGVEFLKEVQRRLHPAPRIMLTGYAALENVVSAINEASVFRYITKPIDGEALQKAIRDAIGHYEIHQENNRLVKLTKALLEKTAGMEKRLLSQGSAAMNSSAEGEAFAPRRHEVVVLYAEIRGFTQAALGVEPEKVIRVLDQVFSPLHEVIYNCGGVMDKRLGDGFMALFGLTGGSTSQAALNCVLNMAQRAKPILEGLEAPFRDLKLSFGLAAGSAVLGLVGQTQSCEFSVVGDSANLAARLQDASKLALTTEVGLQSLGEFKRVMAICNDSMLGIAREFREVTLPSKLSIRDFPEIRKIGVFSL